MFNKPMTFGRDMSDRTYQYMFSLYGEMKTLFFLFRKEKVFRYFLIIIGLNIAAGALFLLLEHDRVLMANPGLDNMPWFDQFVTVFYWAIVTIATCGYGDITPATSAGRIMTIIVLYMSVASVSMFTANLASALTTKKMMERRGVMDLSGYKNHYVICGWKQNMAAMLDEVVFNNPRFRLTNILIIANIEPDAIELFHQQYPLYQEITILRGEHYNESLLRKAAIQQAAQIFILADESIPGASPTETDSKTVMAAMTIRAISKDVRVCAELLDVKFEKYLKTAHIEDIVYTQEYSKVLIAHSFTHAGISKVINDLLSAQTPNFIITERIPDGFIGKKFSDLRDHYHQAHKSLLIGLMENVGSFYERKQEALREAQKTADVNRLIDNLKKAKRLENNYPNINPEDDYAIPQNSMGILISTRKI